MEFSAPATVESNIVLADSETETYYANCIPVQLMAASDARNALNLKTNPGMLGAYVELYGDLERYMLVNGLKSVREYTILSNGNVSIDEIGRLPTTMTTTMPNGSTCRACACLLRARLTASTYAAQPILQRKSQSNAK